MISWGIPTFSNPADDAKAVVLRVSSVAQVA